LALVGLVFDHFERQTRGMPESDEGLPEPLGHRILIHFVALEMVFPERQGSLGHVNAVADTCPEPGRPGLRLYGNGVITDPGSRFAFE
jgi:hypothetical protein